MTDNSPLRAIRTAAANRFVDALDRLIENRADRQAEWAKDHWRDGYLSACDSEIRQAKEDLAGVVVEIIEMVQPSGVASGFAAARAGDSRTVNSLPAMPKNQDLHTGYRPARFYGVVLPGLWGPLLRDQG